MRSTLHPSHPSALSASRGRGLSRRAVLGTAAAVPLAAGLHALPAAADETAGRGHGSDRVGFTLNAEVLDGGEQVLSLTLNTSRLGPIDARALSASSFSVQVSATLPAGAPSGLAFGPYEGPRAVTGVRVDRRGNIVIDLESGPDAVGAGTLAYVLSGGRNWRMNLVYTITQNGPIRLKNGRQLTIGQFVQGALVNPEVDAYSAHTLAGGLSYRLFSPKQGGGKERSHGNGKRPLIVWLHGGGEGAAPGAADNNEGQLRANRGALGFSTPEAQKIFGGAYVVAPQAPTAWMQNGPVFSPQIKAVVDDLIKRYPIDRRQVHVLGCSNGGYMTLRLESDYPTFFASGVPICPGATPNFFTDAELRRVSSTPTWFVHSKDDTTLPYEPNTIRAANLIDGEIVTLYDNVTWDGYQYPGHWSWIYVARNDPQHNGQHIWQWMAAQRRR